MTIRISSDFDAGNILVTAIDGATARLAIRKDAASDFYQWFYFRVDGAAGQDLTLRIENAGGAAYPDGWPGYRARVSDDDATWRLTDTEYADGVLTIRHHAQGDQVWFAYFAPYSSARHADLIARHAAMPGFRHDVLGETRDGRPIDRLRIGTGPTPVWLYARQHPGETMAEWWMEGTLGWLASPAAANLLAKATVHIIPNMNPDGSARGHLRTNAVGVNLNREWADPSPDRSPEVFHVRNAMDESGVDWAIDVHGDEAIPANFIAGYEGIPSWTDAHGARLYAYRDALARRTRDFQTVLGYPMAGPGRANLTMSTNQLAERFGAVAMTLEMPFKDHDANADTNAGWSPERSAALGVACLEELAAQIG